MTTIDALLQGLGLLVAWPTIGWLILGVLIGLLMNLLPGVSHATFWSIALPFLLTMEKMSAFALFSGFLAVGATSDVIPAILIGLPTHSAQATVIDGHALAKRGEGARALGASFTSSIIGGVFGALLLSITVTMIRPFILSIGYPEFLMLSLWGLSMIALLSKGAVLEGLIMGCIGMLLRSVGQDPLVGFPRWTFGTTYLISGIELALFGLAVFGVPELVSMVASGRRITDAPPLQGLFKGQLEGAGDALSNLRTVLRGGLIGSLVGILPGMGGSVAGWLAYGVESQTAKNNQNFGHGDIRGVIAPDSAANAVDGGHLVPLLAFALPGSVSMAFALLVLWGQGVQPGARLLTEQLDLVYFFVWGVVLANLIGGLLCFGAASQLAKICYVDPSYLFALLIPVMFLSTYVAGSQVGDIFVLLVLAAIFFVLKELKWPRPPLLLGFVLGQNVESGLNISTNLYGLSWLARPMVVVIICAIVFGLVWSGLRSRRDAKGKPLGAPMQWTWQAVRQRILSGNFISAVILLGLVTAGLIDAAQWPVDVMRFPAAVGIAAVVLLAIKLIRDVTRADTADAMPVPVQDRITTMQRSLVSFTWLTGIVAGVFTIGLAAALPVFTLTYLRFAGRIAWWPALLATAALGALMWAFFDQIAGIIWYPGLLPASLLELFKI
jgi:TctA family transporter